MKMTNGLYYELSEDEVVLPIVFFHEYPFGLLLKRANYRNNIFTRQGCTVSVYKVNYATIDEKVKMYSN